MAQRDRRMDSVACLCGDWLKRNWRLYHYANLLLHDVTGHVYSTVLLATLVTGVSIWIAYRDVKISARLMLWIEATSVTVIVIVAALLLVRHGLHWDGEQVHLHGMTGSGLRLGLVLALFPYGQRCPLVTPASQALFTFVRRSVVWASRTKPSDLRGKSSCH